MSNFQPTVKALGCSWLSIYTFIFAVPKDHQRFNHNWQRVTSLLSLPIIDLDWPWEFPIERIKTLDTLQGKIYHQTTFSWVPTCTFCFQCCHLLLFQLLSFLPTQNNRVTSGRAVALGLPEPFSKTWLWTGPLRAKQGSMPALSKQNLSVFGNKISSQLSNLNFEFW